MHFSTIIKAASLAVMASASALPVETRSVATFHEAPVEKRQIGTLALAILTAAATEAGTLIVEDAINAIGAAITAEKASWTASRESFTQEVTARMWADKDNSAYVAAVCYNEAYSVQNSANVHGLVSVKLSMGLLHVDYDCMYLSAPNAFYTEGEGGYINVSFDYESPCTYSSSSGDLTCT